MKLYVFDCETAPNFFSVVVMEYRGDKGFTFEISNRVNHQKELADFLATNPQLIGYNSHDYDDVMIVAASTGLTNRQLYNLSKKLIESEEGRSLWDLKKKYKLERESIDLLRMLFSKKLRVGLKSLMVTLKWDNLQDLPFAPDEKIPEDKFDEVLEYNFNDVLFTKYLAQTVKDQLNLRVEIEKKWGLNVMSKDGVGTGVSLLLRLYSNTTGRTENSISKGRTHYEDLRLRDCIVGSIEFKSEEFGALLERYRNQKGLELSEKVEFDGKIYSYGIGGLHTEDESKKYIADDTEVFIDADVTSYYPSQIIHYVLFPSHLGKTFTQVYKEIFDARIKAKKEGDKLTSETFKLALNGSFGNLRNEYSWLYDPKVFFTITVSGQLMLSMLCEMLSLAGFEVISANTDGVTARVPKKRYKEYAAICKQWQQKTGMGLEYTLFSRMYRRDVNCYYHVVCDKNGVETGEVKEKGGWVRDTKIGKGYDKPIVNKALYDYFINGTPPQQTLESSTDIHDFLSAVRVGKQFLVEWGGEPQQRYNRYYVTNSPQGAELMKVFKDSGRKIGLVAGERVMLANRIGDFPKDINYDYYLREINKIITLVEQEQLTLF